MDLKIVWTKGAKNNYIKILEYIEKEFGSGPAKNYHESVEELLQLLTKFPELGSPQAGQDSLRGIILYRRTTIFYTLDQNTIKIINIVDNRWKR
jgi:plasmid stabilization system protein ParE